MNGWMEWAELGETCRDLPKDRLLLNKRNVSSWEWIQGDYASKLNGQNLLKLDKRRIPPNKWQDMLVVLLHHLTKFMGVELGGDSQVNGVGKTW